MRFRRLIWTSMIIVDTWALLYYGRPTFFFLLVFLVAVFVLSAAELALAAFSVRLDSDPNERLPTKYESFHYRLTVRSAFFPLLHVRVSCKHGHTSTTSREKQFFHLSATKTRPAVLKIPLVSEYAGLYELKVDSVEIYDLFGFFCFSVPLRKALRNHTAYIPVFPIIRRFSKAPRVFSELIPPMRKTPERSENVGVREYRPGDDLRTVNWKRTARTGTLYVKEYEKGSQDFHIVYLDLTRPSVTGREATVVTDCLLSQATDLSAFLLRDQRPVTILSHSDANDEQCSILHAGHLEKAKRFLSTRRFVGTVPEDYKDRLSAIWEVGKNSLSVFSSALNPESLSFLSRFSGDLATVTLFMITQPGHESEASSVIEYFSKMGVYCISIRPEDTEESEVDR